MHRTHNLGELTIKDKGKEVELSGWVNKIREHGKVIFVDLRDRYGITQVVFNPDNKGYEVAVKLKREDVISIKGEVRKRLQINKEMKTGEVEVICNEVNIITKSSKLPMELDESVDTTDEVRLKYRYIDLRKPRMIGNLQLRHRAMMASHEYFDKEGFLFVETPILMRSTPEGARDYVVPSRVNNGKFYALPQSPQLYKQILMISGIDKYYQMAKCLRDEDLRADRQPEHTQFDLEMSFCDEKDVMKVVEGLFKHIWKKTINYELEKFPVLSYEEAMNRFGSDKPDLRFGMELIEMSEIGKKSEFNVFKQAENVKCLYVEKEYSRKEIDKLTEIAKKEGAKGLAFVKVNGKFDSGVSKFLESVEKEIISKTGKKGTIFFVADKKNIVNKTLGKLRNIFGDDLGLKDKNIYKGCWVVDFPLFEYDSEEGKWIPCHHIFSMPKEECMEYLEKDPGKVLANLYDVVVNGLELGSGSMRIHDPAIQERVMKVIGMKKEDAYNKFGFLLDAYKFGSPMHGGMGLGFDRTVALLAKEDDIREVIAFPKNKNAECPMDDSPNVIDKQQLDELGIKLK